MTAYIGILEKEPGTLWGVWFPDLPGCIAAAETADATVEQAGEALAQWIAVAQEDGQPVAPPRTIEALRADGDVAEALAAGHVAILVRPPVDELDLDADQIRAIDAVAERRGLSRRALVREIVLSKIAG
ncbi:type II toxin-antitoxin system HicB family antitoxin [Methylobacterium oxalidis]|uniref:type II toxin-antitoxin system HicB family antitoxin n=1 Tax=Methylobacterium oxalidis TaxID=944322 RepID=UPI00331508CD